MACSIDAEASPEFVKRLARLKRDFPSIDSDLARLYEDIAKLHPRVPNSFSIPGYAGSVWKFRCESMDMKRGKSGSFRILAHFDQAKAIMRPFIVYTKKEYEKSAKGQPTGDEIKKWIKALVIKSPETD